MFASINGTHSPDWNIQNDLIHHWDEHVNKSEFYRQFLDTKYWKDNDKVKIFTMLLCCSLIQMFRCIDLRTSATFNGYSNSYTHISLRL